MKQHFMLETTVLDQDVRHMMPRKFCLILRQLDLTYWSERNSKLIDGEVIGNSFPGYTWERVVNF